MSEQNSDAQNNRPEWDGKDDLYIGVKNDLSPFTVDLKALTRGLVVVGQSGCGKSFMLGRIVEEIVRKTKETRILIIDANADFSQGVEFIDDQEFNETLDKYHDGLHEKEYKALRRREKRLFVKLNKASSPKWPKYSVFRKKDNHHSMKECEYTFNLAWHCLTPEQKLIILCGNANDEGIDIVLEKFGEIIDEKIAKKKLENTISLWKSANNEYFLADLFEHVFYLDKGYLIKFMNFMNNISFEDIWENTIENENSQKSRILKNRINIINIGSLLYGISKQVVTFYILQQEALRHKKAYEQFLDLDNVTKEEIIKYEKERHIKHPEDPRLRSFLIIDEAHNFAGNEYDDPHSKLLGEFIHLIAAEGRKYGAHLILATQRPNKVKKGLLGECDNAIIMKMNSRSDLEELAKEMRILDVKLLEPCLSFQGQGNAIAVGEMTKMAPYTQIFKSAPRRTKEGGVDIPFF